MKDLSSEIRAYALQNAIEFGKADPGRILPKLFQHGLDKKDIGSIMPSIQAIVKEINSFSEDEKKKAFSDLQGIVKKREEPEERELPELPNAGKGMVFRVAPFPSGALHIGNAKTFLLNALYAEKYKAKTLLIIDDTIGSEEKPITKEGYKLIPQAFDWLHVDYHKPIIYKSDRLKIYYKYAEEIISKGKAYVCYCPQETLRENRAKGIECACRQFPPAIQKERWKEMFKEEEGHAVLRLKTDMLHPNPAFRDRVLFKITDRPHPKVGKKYRVWPSLEMTWAIDDHLLGITHILRGNDLMIETDMEKYIWDIFGWKHVTTLHAGLVKIDGLGAKLSKSKSQAEVKSGAFIGWDDPRTWSIQSLARRGFRREAIREFVKDIGLNKQDITVPIDSLYAQNRKIIDSSSDRYSFVQDPVEISFKNDPGIKETEVPIHPDKRETRNIKVKDKIFVSGKDFEEMKGKEVRLLHLCTVKLDKKATITSIDKTSVPKLNWVSENVKVKILKEDGTWVEGLGEKAVGKLKKGAVIQFERFGFVKFDQKNGQYYEFWFAHR